MFRKYRTTSSLPKSARHTMQINTGHKRMLMRLGTLSCSPLKIAAATTNAKAKHGLPNMMAPTQSHTHSLNAQSTPLNYPTTPTPSLVSMHTYWNNISPMTHLFSLTTNPPGHVLLSLKMEQRSGILTRLWMPADMAVVYNTLSIMKAMGRNMMSGAPAQKWLTLMPLTDGKMKMGLRSEMHKKFSSGEECKPSTTNLQQHNPPLLTITAAATHIPAAYILATHTHWLNTYLPAGHIITSWTHTHQPDKPSPARHILTSLTHNHWPDIYLLAKHILTG
jgi:hypothetical protein